MLDDETSTTTTQDSTTETPTEAAPRRTRRRAASRPAGPPTSEPTSPAPEPATDAATAKPAKTPKTPKKTAAKKTAKKSAAKKAIAAPAEKQATEEQAPAESAADAGTAGPTAKKGKTKKATKKSAKTPKAQVEARDESPDVQAAVEEQRSTSAEAADSTAGPGFAPLFQAPEITSVPARGTSTTASDDDAQRAADQPVDSEPAEADTTSRRRRSRGGRNRRKSSEGDQQAGDATGPAATDAEPDDAGKSKKAADRAKGGDRAKSDQAKDDRAKDDGSQGEPTEGGTSRRRRRRSRGGDEGAESGDKDGRAREGAKSDKESISGVEGSTRIEAKKQRRREGREAGRRRAPILSESEFLARRESVDRVMAIRQHGEKTQIAVLEDNVLVEHYVAIESQGSIIGNVYLGKVQNVLPSMEAAFIDIGRGRNAVLYAGEVNWDLVPDRNAPRRIENALKPGQAVLVQVTKDPVGHKGARLTAQISLPGRYLVYVPGGGTSGISRKLPDTERTRLKTLLKEILPEDAGVIIRTAAEGASEEALTRDVNRLTARWEDIDKKVKAGQAPSALYAEPDTVLKVVRDLFTEDFTKLVISGDDAWDIVDGYVQHVAPDLADRLERYDGDGDVFADRRVDEQIAKALDRKVWLPSGGSLVIDRTEAMTVIDVNTGKFTGAGGNLEETVTKNNLEAAEEIVRQLRLRDIGGIIVIDFIDMVLEGNRDLVLRRLVECLGRDRTRHQVAEVTSLGLVQMTRKRISTGLLEAFSHSCENCQGRGVVVESEPVEPKQTEDSTGPRRGSGSRRSSSRRRGKSGGKDTEQGGDGQARGDGQADSDGQTEGDSGTGSEAASGDGASAGSDGSGSDGAGSDGAGSERSAGSTKRSRTRAKEKADAAG